MAGRYSQEDLYKLRESPLVAPPPGLPPKEEWMSTTETRTRQPGTRTRDDVFGSADGFQKRPGLGDAAKRSTTDPDKIHLGPPRHSFASSRAREDKDGNKMGKTTAFGTSSFRGDDSEDTRPPRRSYKDSSLEEGVSTRGHRSTSSKFDQPWTRKDRSADLDNDSNPLWRRGNRERDAERQEAEPEWADADEPADSSKPHTLADLTAFMDQMKRKDTATAAPASAPAKQAEKEVLGDEASSKIKADHEYSDKFFADYNHKMASFPPVVAKPAKSRFAGFFGEKEKPAEKPAAAKPVAEPAQKAYPGLFPPATIVAQPPSKVASTVDSVANEPEQSQAPASKGPNKDNEAIQALLSMLSKSKDGLSQNSAGTQPAPTPNVAAISTKSPAVPAAGPAHTPKMSLDRIIDSRSPANKARPESERSSSTGAQELLNLLKKHDQREGSPVVDERHPPGLAVRRQRDGLRSIYDDPAMAGYRGQNLGRQHGQGVLFASMNDQSHQANQAVYGYNPLAAPAARPPPTTLSSQQLPPPGLEPPPQSPPRAMPIRAPRQPPGFENVGESFVQQPQPQRPVPNASYAMASLPQLSGQQHQRRPTNEFAQPNYVSPPPGLSAAQRRSPSRQLTVHDLLIRGEGTYTMTERRALEQAYQRQVEERVRQETLAGFASMYPNHQSGNDGYRPARYGYQ